VGDSVKVTDVQGFVANVNKHVAIDDNKTFHPVDKVLLPGKQIGTLTKYKHGSSGMRCSSSATAICAAGIRGLVETTTAGPVTVLDALHCCLLLLVAPVPHADSVFTDLRSLCEFRALTLKTLCHAVVCAGLNEALSPATQAITIFAPNNKAFANGIQLKGGVVPSPAKAADLLK
jgi:hypothetical protein